MSIDIKITPGEWVDRFTILQVKLANIKDEEKVQALALRVQAEWPNLETWHAGRVAEALKSIPVLTSIHQRLWWLENRVRTDDPDFTVAEWEEVIWDYFNVYAGVRRWHNHMERTLKSTGQTKDIFGRIRRIPSVVIRNSYKHALNQIVNFGPQSGACGLMQLAMTKLRQELKDMGIWLKGVWPVNMVHDEIVLEIEEDLVSTAEPIITKWLENVVSLDVPIRTSPCVTDNWHSAK